MVGFLNPGTPLQPSVPVAVHEAPAERQTTQAPTPSKQSSRSRAAPGRSKSTSGSASKSLPSVEDPARQIPPPTTTSRVPAPSGSSSKAAAIEPDNPKNTPSVKAASRRVKVEVQAPAKQVTSVPVSDKKQGGGATSGTRRSRESKVAGSSRSAAIPVDAVAAGAETPSVTVSHSAKQGNGARPSSARPSDPTSSAKSGGASRSGSSRTKTVAAAASPPSPAPLEDAGAKLESTSLAPAEDAPADVPVPAPVKPSAGRSFKSVVKSTTPKTAVPFKALGGAYFHKPAPPPEEDQVMDPDLQDPLLKYMYDGPPQPVLCALRSGLFKVWMPGQGKGFYSFSNWVHDCPELSFDSAINVISFVSHKHFLNPSRFSPQEVLVREFPGASPLLHLYTGDRKPAVCVSAVQVTESYLTAPCQVGVKQKKIHGIFHTQEFERVVGFVTTAFSKDKLSSQLAKCEMQFSTRSAYGDAQSTPSGKRYSPKKPSPATMSATTSTNAPTDNSYTLDIDDEVPVYDCRAMLVDLNKDLDRLDALPKWKGEIPPNSFAAVGYTVSVFFSRNKSKGWSVSFNIRWVMLLGVGVENGTESDD